MGRCVLVEPDRLMSKVSKHKRGRTESGEASMLHVRARSVALIPVVTPCLASHEIVYAVRKLSSFLSTISGRPNSTNLSSDIGTHISPEVYRIMNAIFFGVKCAAEIIRSPSFSLDGSSMTMRNSPFAKARRASSIDDIGIL